MCVQSLQLSLQRIHKYIFKNTNLKNADSHTWSPFTSGQDLWPRLEQGFQASLADFSDQNIKAISWCDVILSSCDYTHSPSVVSVRNNKHCGFQLFLLTEKVGSLWASVFCTSTIERRSATDMK